MAINLRWSNLNTPSSILAVYRSDTPNPDYRNTQDQPLVILAGDATSYRDDTTVSGQLYYYSIKVTNGASVSWTPQFSSADIMKRGPGPNIIIKGNNRLGYFGTVDALELPTIYDDPGINKFITTNMLRAPWHKFVRKGKILYVPKWLPVTGPASTAGISASVFEKKYGTDNGIEWNFNPADKGWADAGKETVVSLNGYSYHPRLPRGFPDDWDGVSINGVDLTNLANNPLTEFNEVIQCILPETTYPSDIGALSVSVGDPDILAYNPMMCAERLSTNGIYYLQRGTAVAPIGSTTYSSNGPTLTSSTTASNSNSSGVTAMMILELIEG